MNVNPMLEETLPVFGILKINYPYFNENIDRYLRFFSAEEKEEINKIKRKKKKYKQ